MKSGTQPYSVFYVGVLSAVFTGDIEVFKFVCVCVVSVVGEFADSLSSSLAISG